MEIKKASTFKHKGCVYILGAAL